MKNSKLRTVEWVTAILSTIVGLALVILAYVLNFQKEEVAWYIYLFYVLGAIGLFVAAFTIYSIYGKKKENHHTLSVKEITMIGVQSAITIILYYFIKFNLPFFPSWLDIQVSEIPALITAFAYGPYAGSIVIFIRFIVKLPATMTLGVGELADLALGLCLVIIAGSIYRKNKTLKNALIGTGIGIAVSTVLACILNWTILIPAFRYIAHFPLEALIGGMSYISGINESNFMMYYIFIGVLPFNIFRYLLVFAFTFLLYKRIHILLQRMTK